ncbi:MAG: anti-sigma factor family protein [bacterium]
MKCDFQKETLIAFFYNDLEKEEMTKVRAHLKKCSACKKDLEQFAETRLFLKAWPDEEPNLNLQFIPEKTSFWSWLTPTWLPERRGRKLAVGFAAALALALIALSALNFEASYSDAGFNVKLSLLPRQDTQIEPPQDPLSMPVSRREFDTWKAESYQLIQQLIEETETRNRRDYRMALSELAREMDSQRRQDLQWVGKGFEIVHSESQYKIERTQEMLNQLIKVANYQISRPDSGQNK